MTRGIPIGMTHGIMDIEDITVTTAGLLLGDTTDMRAGVILITMIPGGTSIHITEDIITAGTTIQTGTLERPIIGEARRHIMMEHTEAETSVDTEETTHRARVLHADM